MPPSASRTSSEESASGPKRCRRKSSGPTPETWQSSMALPPRSRSGSCTMEAEDSEEVVSHHPAPHPQVFENGGGSMKEQPYILQLDRRTFYGCHGRAWQDGPFRWDYRKASSFTAVLFAYTDSISAWQQNGRFISWSMESREPERSGSALSARGFTRHSEWRRKDEKAAQHYPL